FFFQAEDGIRDWSVTGVQTCALPISRHTTGRLAERTLDLRDQGIQLRRAGLADIDAVTSLGMQAIRFDAQVCGVAERPDTAAARSEEHTSELQSLTNLVCRLLLEQKK